MQQITTSSKTISGTLNSSGRGTVNYDATLTQQIYKSADFQCRYRVTVPFLVPSTVTSNADTDAAWFIKNEWYRQTYYAVSPGYLPGGGGSCVAGSTCLTVQKLPSGTTNDKKAILIFAGRALTGTRPSATLANYLEGENQTPADRIFTHNVGSALTLNDRAIVLSP